ncbi:phage tail tape measure protein [Desulfosporosinus sp. OT]|uniref:phage tail tape measure protein n=1 Tax=Desulfosporosinus sp. OT TaxID=913865 RepID=UPI001A98D821|nr:phage tail tape measure protein [Desulfosporosinus sp. OT]
MFDTEIFKLFGSILIDNEKANQSIDATDKKAQGTTKTFGSMLGSALKVGAGIAAAIGAAAISVGGLAVSLTDDLTKSLNGVQASTGVADDMMGDMKDTMLAIYNNNFGENFEEIGSAMSLVNQQTGLAGDALQGMTENALALKDTFGMEVADSLRGANQLMKQFGMDGDEAYNLIAQGAQWGLDANGDLIDTLNEYSGTFAAQGFSAEEMFNMLSNGAASGVRDVDLLADAIKEFGIRSKDGSTTSAAGFQALGLNATEMTKAFATGGETAKTAFDKTTQALISMKDPVAQNAAGVALFGTQFEDLGIKGITALVNTQGEITKTNDALGKINEVKYNTFGEAIEGIKRNLQTGLLIPLGEQILPKMNEFAGWISGNMPIIQNEISYAMGIVDKIFDGIGSVIETYIMPQFNSFKGMVSENMPQIKAAIQAMYDYVKPSFDQLWQVIRDDLMPIIQGLWDLVQRAMPTIRVIFEVAMLAVGAALKVAMGVISLFIEAAKGIYDFIKPKIDLVIDIFNTVSTVIEKALGWLLKWNKTDAKDKTVKVSYNSTSDGMKAARNANGTDNWRGGLTWVGEEGPELLNLPRGSQIFSNEESMAMAGSGVASSSPVIFERGAFEGANIMDDYGVDRLMDRIMDRLALKGVR